MDAVNIEWSTRDNKITEAKEKALGDEEQLAKDHKETIEKLEKELKGVTKKLDDISKANEKDETDLRK